MVVVLVCAVLVAAGLAAAVAWGGRPFTPPPPADELTPVELARRMAWWCSLIFIAGIPAGLAIIGGGGRLAMRLLAVTAGDAAQGRVTEADEIVGQITVDGTIGFVLFNGIFGGVFGGAIYLLARRYLPAGRAQGVAFGVGLLTVFGALIDPLRAENPDFDIVGPGWLAVVVFAAMAVAFGLTLQAMMARASAWLPLFSGDRRTQLKYLPAALIAVPGFSITAFLVVLYVLVLVVTRWPPVLRAARSPQLLTIGRVAVGLVVLVSVPNTVSNIADIVSRP